jgi:hypothetical protein
MMHSTEKTRSSARKHGLQASSPSSPRSGGVTNTKGQVSLSQDIRCTTTVQFDRRYRRYICGFVDLLDRDGGLPSRESRSVGDDPVTNIEVEANQFVNVLSEI